jgi:alanine-synthesizing transaminase
VHPGYFFGMADAGWLVVSLLGPEAEFSTGVTRLLNYLDKNQQNYKIGNEL